MDVIIDPQSMQETCHLARLSGMSIGFVPTMGAIHEGHLALVHAARADSDLVAVSLFVNPTQFTPDEDYEKYPRSLEKDLELCESNGVNLVFTPQVEGLYPPDSSSYVIVEGLTKRWEGEFRPGHFRGVTTVVMKLLQIVNPHRMYMGEKDYQQLQVCRRMTRDFFLGTEVIGVPTVRESDGLALSSRNVYLSEEERQTALILPRTLHHCAQSLDGGERRAWIIQREGLDHLSTAREITVDYFGAADPYSLRELDIIDKEAVLLAAIRVGTTRLIDNRIWREPEKSVSHADLG